MKLYFLCENNEQLGPFSFDQLIKKGINYNTPIWKEGYVGWAKAGEVDEFKSLLPVPVREKTPAKEKPDLRMSTSLSSFGLIFLVLLLFGFIAYKSQEVSSPIPVVSSSPDISKDLSGKEKNGEEKKMEPVKDKK